MGRKFDSLRSREFNCIRKGFITTGKENKIMETHFDNIEREHDAISKDKVMDDLKTLARDAEELLKESTHDRIAKKIQVKRGTVKSRPPKPKLSKIKLCGYHICGYPTEAESSR